MCVTEINSALSMFSFLHQRFVGDKFHEKSTGENALYDIHAINKSWINFII